MDANPTPDLRERLWSGVGLFAASEAKVDQAIASYTRSIPAAIRKQVLRPMRNHERASALKAILADRSLSAGYPDITHTFLAVKKTRDAVVHSTLSHSVDGEFRLSRFGERHAEVLSPKDVRAFHDDAVRLDNTLMTLLFELEVIPTVTLVTAGGPRQLTGVDLIGEFAPDEPRPEFWTLIERLQGKLP